MVQINADERYAIRFGCFPAQQVKAAVAAGEDELKLYAVLAELARRYSGDAVPAPQTTPQPRQLMHRPPRHRPRARYRASWRCRRCTRADDRQRSDDPPAALPFQERIRGRIVRYATSMPPLITGRVGIVTTASAIIVRARSGCACCRRAIICAAISPSVNACNAPWRERSPYSGISTVKGQRHVFSAINEARTGLQPAARLRR